MAIEQLKLNIVRLSEYTGEHTGIFVGGPLVDPANWNHELAMGHDVVGIIASPYVQHYTLTPKELQDHIYWNYDFTPYVWGLKDDLGQMPYLEEEMSSQYFERHLLSSASGTGLAITYARLLSDLAAGAIRIPTGQIDLVHAFVPSLFHSTEEILLRELTKALEREDVKDIIQRQHLPSGDTIVQTHRLVDDWPVIPRAISLGGHHLPGPYWNFLYGTDDFGSHTNPLNVEETHHPLDGPWGKAAFDFYISPCGEWGGTDDLSFLFDEQEIMNLYRVKEGTELSEVYYHLPTSSRYELITTIFPPTE